MRQRLSAITRITAVCALVVTAPAWGQSSTTQDQEINLYGREVQTRLAPAGPFTETIQGTLQGIDPRIGIEVAVVVPVTDEAFTAEGHRTIYNILRSISTMEGITYYSASRDEMRTFYHESYAVNDPDERLRIDDPLVDAVPNESRLWAFQRDGSFGRNVQQLDYTVTDRTILLRMENLTTMVYQVVPLVFPGNLRTILLVQPDPADQTLRFYGNIAVRVPGLFGMEERARDSFSNRIIALHGWFITELERAGLTR